MKFKKGAFKMAYKAGAPVIPVSIVGAGKVMPPHWMFPLMQLLPQAPLQNPARQI